MAELDLTAVDLASINDALQAIAVQGERYAVHLMAKTSPNRCDVKVGEWHSSGLLIATLC